MINLDPKPSVNLARDADEKARKDNAYRLLRLREAEALPQTEKVLLASETVPKGKI